MSELRVCVARQQTLRDAAKGQVTCTRHGAWLSKQADHMIQRSIEVSPHIMPHSDKSEDPDLKANKSMHAHTHTHTHIIKQCLVSALAQPQECVWLQYTARLTAHMDAISVKTDRRCCNDALMMPQNLLLGSAPNLMLFSCVPCLHNVLQYIKTVLSQQGVMLSACHEVLLFNAG